MEIGTDLGATQRWLIRREPRRMVLTKTKGQLQSERRRISWIVWRIPGILLSIAAICVLVATAAALLGDGAPDPKMAISTIVDAAGFALALVGIPLSILWLTLGPFCLIDIISFRKGRNVEIELDAHTDAIRINGSRRGALSGSESVQVMDYQEGSYVGGTTIAIILSWQKRTGHLSWLNWSGAVILDTGLQHEHALGLGSEIAAFTGLPLHVTSPMQMAR